MKSLCKNDKAKGISSPFLPSPDKSVSSVQVQNWHRVWGNSWFPHPPPPSLMKSLHERVMRPLAYSSASPSTFTSTNIHSKIFQNNNNIKKKKEDCSNTELSMSLSQVTPAALAWFLHLGSKAGNKKISMNSILRILATYRTGELKGILCWKQNWWKKILYAHHSSPCNLMASR